MRQADILRVDRRRFRVAQRSFRVDTPQHFQHHFIIGLMVDIVDVDVADITALIDDEDRPLAMPIRLAEYAVHLRHPAMRPKITRQRIIDSPERHCPCFQARNMINAYAQNLSIQCREQAIIGLVRRHLARSDGRPGKREEHQDDIFPQVIAELDVFVQMR